MAGIRNRCATNFQQIASRAPYFHCARLDLITLRAGNIENIGHFLQVFTKKAETTGKFH